MGSSDNFNLAQTLDCGQAFRWKPNENGVWSGIAYGRKISLCEINGEILINGADNNDIDKIWRNYFDLERDYAEIISELGNNEVLKRAAEYGSGIRILRQEPWEALCSFIISQNNNIPRIKGIIERLCEGFGEKHGDYYSFPTAEKLAVLTPDDLSTIRAGFRAKYIIDAAVKVADGHIDLNALKTASDEEARNALMSIKGVGPKVADCAMLYGLGRIEAFPRDVWIKRAMTEMFAGELPQCAVPYAGIAQQYIFYYIRNNEK